MKRGHHLATWTIAALAACVPAGEEGAPRGAAGFAVVPSPTTSGEPFRTRDGYTIRVERLVVYLVASSETNEPGGGTRSQDSGLLVGVTAPFETFVPGIREGSTSLSMGFLSGLPSQDREIVGISEAERARFRRDADCVPSKDSGYRRPPAVRLVARIEGMGARYAIDVTIAAAVSTRVSRTVVVRRDSLTTVPATLHAEALFSVGGRALGITASESAPEPSGTFQSFADADTDKDGALTSSELLAARPSEDEELDARTHLLFPVTNLGELLVARTTRLIGY